MISIKEIATLAKTSPGTVDRVLHNRGRVSTKTATRVRSIVKKLGYKTNIYARNLSLAKVFQFGVVMPRLSQDGEYWRIPASGIERAKRELEAQRATIQYFFYDRYSEPSFRKAMERALQKDLDGLLIAPVLSDVARGIINAIPPRIPYVFFDSHVPGTNCLSTIGQESFPSGVLSARLMHLLLPKPGSANGRSVIILIKVLPKDVHIDERISGFHAYLKDHQHFQTVVYEVDSNAGEEGFHKVLDAAFAEHPDLQGIFVSNAWTYPAAHYIRAHGYAKNIRLIGYDVIPKNIQYLREGIIDFIVSPRPETQGYIGIHSLYRHVMLKGTVKKKMSVPVDILTKENVMFYDFD